MPDVFLHNLLADHVLEKLDRETESAINHDIFRFSVMAPDIYLFYRFMFPYFRQKIHERSQIMHRTGVQDYLVELSRRSQSTESFSFLAGVLCHYALDSTCHPWINENGQHNPVMHVAIEHRADAIALERLGRDRKDIMKLFTRFCSIPEADDAARQVYGWGQEHRRAGYAYLKLYYWLIKDRHGILAFLFRRGKGKLSAFSYGTHLCDTMDLNPLFEEEKKAEDFGVKLITAAYSFIRQQTDETQLRTVLGNRTYAGEPAE